MASGGYSDLERGHDETFDYLCSVCKGHNKDVEAEKFCTQCQDYYCMSCVKIHEQVKGMKHHKILDKSQFPLGSSAMFPVVPTETCKHHGHKPVDMFCEQHDKVGCSTCMLVDHKYCENFYIPDYIKKKPAGSPADMSAHLDTLKNSIQELQKACNDEDRKLKTSKDAVVSQIQQLRKEINHRLDELESNTMKEADTTFQSITDNIQVRLKQSQDLMDEIKATQNSLNAVAGNQAQLFVSMKQASDVVSRATGIVQTASKTALLPDISFLADQKLQTLLQELKVLGSIVVTEAIQSIHPQQQTSLSEKTHPTKQSAPTLVTKATTESQLKTQQQMPSLLQVQKPKSCPVKLSSDTDTCNILSACVLDDGTVILADYHNNKLKCLDRSTYRVRDSCDVPQRPWQVCVISQQEVAVSCFYSKLIQFVSVGSTMCCTRQIHTDFKCHGLACADGKLYVSDKDTSVYVYTVSGERLQQFNKSGQSLFSDIFSLAVSSDNSRIYVADCYKGLIILDTSGKLVSQYNDPQLDGATDVCLHKNDSVLVCGCWSKNVLQFSANGQLVGQVLKTDKSSQALCWNEKNSRLIVGYFEEDNIDMFVIK